MKKGHKKSIPAWIFGIGCFFLVCIMGGCGSSGLLSGESENTALSEQTELPESPDPETVEEPDPTKQLSKIEPITKAQEMEHVAAEEVYEEPDEKEQEKNQSEREYIGLGPSDLEELKRQQIGNYYYELLNDPGKTMYVEMLQILLCQATDIQLSGRDLEHLGMVYQCVINDHPELFYLSGYSYVSHKIGDELKYITFSGSYMDDPQQVKTKAAAVEAKAKEILSGIPADADQYEIVKYLYEYIILNTEYSFESADNQNICSVFLDHKSVCNGYAKAMQFLLQKKGIPCILVIGQAGGGSHAWNIVKVDGAYYHVDTTWGDPSYYNDLQQGERTPDIDYSYLCIPTGEIERTHEMDQTYPLPQCSSLAANYFVREGLYFNQVEEKRLRSIFGEAEKNPENVVILKASDAVVYQELFEHLITQENIFSYYRVYDGKGNLTVSYSQNDYTYTLSFWN